jgi:hypothetical protein
MLAELWDSVKNLLSRFRKPDDDPRGEIDEGALSEAKDSFVQEPKADPVADTQIFQAVKPTHPEVPLSWGFSPSSQPPDLSPSQPKAENIPPYMQDAMPKSTVPGLSQPNQTSSEPPQFIRFTDPAPNPDGTPRKFTQPSEARIEQMISNAEDDMALPMTKKVRIPPELAGQDVPPPGGGFQLTGNAPSQQAQPVVSGNDKPMTERQGDQMIRALDEHKNILNSIKSSTDAVAAAIQNLSTSMKDYGGVVP